MVTQTRAAPAQGAAIAVFLAKILPPEAHAAAVATPPGPRALTPLTFRPMHDNTCMECAWLVHAMCKPRSPRKPRLTHHFPPLVLLSPEPSPC